jgi:hypothetical protein
MLAEASDIAYLHEPLNPDSSPGLRGFRLATWFLYICDENGPRYEPELRRMLGYRHSLAHGLGAVRGPRSAAALWRDRTFFRDSSRAHRRPLAKDPIAVFSAEWLAATFEMDVVVLIRHPAAVVSSLLQLGAIPSCARLLAQPLLTRDRLGQFRKQLEELREQPGDRLLEAALLWRLVYHVVEQYRSRHANWIFVRHEDISRRPVEAFADLYGKLGIEFTAAAEASVRRHSAVQNPRELESPFDIRLASASSLDNWRRRLSPADVERVRRITAGGAPFYGAGDW